MNDGGMTCMTELDMGKKKKIWRQFAKNFEIAKMAKFFAKSRKILPSPIFAKILT
jgi:hypothetical protein